MSVTGSRAYERRAPQRQPAMLIYPLSPSPSLSLSLIRRNGPQQEADEDCSKGRAQGGAPGLAQGKEAQPQIRPRRQARRVGLSPSPPIYSSLSLSTAVSASAVPRLQLGSASFSACCWAALSRFISQRDEDRRRGLCLADPPPSFSPSLLLSFCALSFSLSAARARAPCVW